MSPDEEETAVLGLLVVLLRSLRHWPQAELARASGVHKSEISLYELWKKRPSENVLRRLAAAAWIPWAETRAMLSALRPLVRLAAHPDARYLEPPGARAAAAGIGRAVTSNYREKIAPLFRELFPDLESIEEPAPKLPDREVEPAAVGLVIVLLRSLRHWTQVELAAASGIQRSQISAYELGTKKPRTRTFERLTAAAGIPAAGALALLPFLRRLVRTAHGERRSIHELGETLGQIAAEIYLLHAASFLDVGEAGPRSTP